MTTIIAGMFDTIDKAQSAMNRLLNGEFGRQDVCSFANNPPGQHATFPIGGDENEDPGAVHADAQAGKGAAIGLGTGAAIGAVTAGPPGAAVGAGIGAYVGSLVGALHGMEGSGTDEEPARRPAGVMVAVRIESGGAEQSAIATLQAQGAIHVEKAEGEWREGKWIDFNPVSVPVILDTSEPAGESATRKENKS
jgi:outer membrane lipoprotein SlyB